MVGFTHNQNNFLVEADNLDAQEYKRKSFCPIAARHENFIIGTASRCRLRCERCLGLSQPKKCIYNQISADIWVGIMFYLKMKEIIRVKYICHGWNRLLNEPNGGMNNFWRMESFKICPNLEKIVRSTHFITRNWCHFYFQLKKILLHSGYYHNYIYKLIPWGVYQEIGDWKDYREQYQEYANGDYDDDYFSYDYRYSYDYGDAHRWDDDVANGPSSWLIRDLVKKTRSKIRLNHINYNLPDFVFDEQLIDAICQCDTPLILDLVLCVCDKNKNHKKMVNVLKKCFKTCVRYGSDNMCKYILQHVSSRDLVKNKHDKHDQEMLFDAMLGGNERVINMVLNDGSLFEEKSAALQVKKDPIKLFSGFNHWDELSPHKRISDKTFELIIDKFYQYLQQVLYFLIDYNKCSDYHIHVLNQFVTSPKINVNIENVNNETPLIYAF